MAKRENASTRTNSVMSTTDASGDRTTAAAIEQRVVAFAEQLGRIAGTVQAKAEGWLDRDALKKQLASVRDGAAELMEQLAGGAVDASKQTPVVAAPLQEPKGRSGGVVDARGKKHRKPIPSDPAAKTLSSQGAKMRTAKTMVKTNRRRGRG
jgi:hypothetical protein